MTKTDYLHLLSALFFLAGGVLYTFSQRLFGRAPRWPLPYGGYAMSPFSRWLTLSVASGYALWEFAKVFFDIEPSRIGVSLSITSVVALGAGFRHDRNHSLANTKVA